MNERIEKIWLNITVASILPLCLSVEVAPLPILIIWGVNTALCGIHLHLNRKREEARVNYLLKRAKTFDPLPFLFEERD